MRKFKTKQSGVLVSRAFEESDDDRSPATEQAVEMASEQSMASAGRRNRSTIAALLMAGVATSGCGGAGSDPQGPPNPPAPPAPLGPPAPAPGPAPAPAPPGGGPSDPVFDLSDASRLLAQATFGANWTQVQRTKSMGASAWVDEQLAMPREMPHVQWLASQGYSDASFINSRTAINYSMWRAFLSRNDQLRQRMVYALSQILVISVNGLNLPWPNFAAAYFLDVLDEHAFGNFRALLQAVTLSPAMGSYLSMRGSQKANAAGRQPDENYAREVMQLFTIGLVELAQDGSVAMDGQRARETYDATDVSQLARVFTGWDLIENAPENGIDNTTPIRVISPMEPYQSRHETGTKTFLGLTIPAGQYAADDLKQALDHLFAHPNVGPFISRQLIQRLVMANPSAPYVARVAAVFADNGSGVRGDLKAVLRAILLDREARVTSIGAVGKLREPVLRFTQWARLAGATSPSGQWKLGSFADPATGLGQSPLQSSSVFNFYRPGYVPPGTSIAAAGLVSPEMQIATETSVAAYINFMQSAVAITTGGFRGSDLTVDYSELLAIAGDATALFDRLNLVLAAGAIGPNTRSILTPAIESIAAATDGGKLNRVRVALLIVLSSPEYIAQK